MTSGLKTVLTLLLVLTMTASAAAQAAGNWQRIHGQVQTVQGTQLTFKADDGRVLHVDIAGVSQPVQHALAPNLGATLVGFPGERPNRFSARYIIQDNAGSAATAPAASLADRVVSLIPQFLGSQEFQELRAGLQNNRAAAMVFVTQLYQGFLERAPNIQERNDWAAFLVQTGDLRSAAEYFVKSPEYTQKNKNEQQAIRDLYEGLFGRTASDDEVRTWQQRLAQK